MQAGSRRAVETPGAPSRRGDVGVALLLALAAAGACGPEAPARTPETSVRQRIEALLGGEAGDRVAVTTAEGDSILLSPDLAALYRDRGWEPLWTGSDGLEAPGRALVAALESVEAEGLDPDRYERELVLELVEPLRPPRTVLDDAPGAERRMGDADIVLSEAFLRLSTDLRRGTLDPEESGILWHIERGDPTPAATLADMLDGRELPALLDSLRPAVPQYDHLRGALARYRRIEARGGWPAVPDSGGPLERGATGPRVDALRERLLDEEDPAEAPLVRGYEASGAFGKELEEAVRHFQRRHGIEATGSVGEATLEALNTPVEERVRELAVNLDRWRWLPRDLGRRYILVNVAGFEAEVVDGGETVLETDVVVGEQGWETPSFRDTLEYIVVNPYWNVPESIAEEEVIPKARENPRYLEENHYEVVSLDGERVFDPDSVALDAPDVRIRQRPGGGNALGDVKFLFPNEHDIYLHDTPAEHLFERTGRAFSHGCIRVARPVELAHYLFRTSTAHPPDHFDELRRSGEHRWIDVTDPVPVYVLYFTAWVERDGVVRFHDDVYGWDEGLEEGVRP